MNTRDTLTLIGGVCIAVGPAMQTNAPSPKLFWLGSILTALGGALLASKAFTSTKQ